MKSNTTKPHVQRLIDCAQSIIDNAEALLNGVHGQTGLDITIKIRGSELPDVAATIIYDPSRKKEHIITTT